MARIRTVKPEFWQDEKLARLDPLTRLVFLAVISMADDGGRLVDNLKLIDGFVFPETDDTAAAALDTLARLSRITRYVSSSGQRLIQVTNWERHQKVDHPNKYTLPAPTPEDLAKSPVTESSRNPRESGATDSRKSLATTNDLRPTTNDQLLVAASATNGTKGKRHKPPRDPPGLPNWVTEAVEIRTKHLGAMGHGKLGGILKPVVDKHGWEAVRPVWAYFCEFSPVQDYLARAEAGTLREGEQPVRKYDYKTSPAFFAEHYTALAREVTA